MATTTGQKVLMGLGAVFVGQQLFTIVGQSLYNKIEFQIGTPSVDTTKFPQGILTVQLPINITNRNPIGVGIQSLTGVVTYGQVRVADVNLPIGVSIPANGAVPLNINLDINVTNIIQDITSIIQSGTGAFNALINPIRLQAQLRTNLFGLTIPIDTNIPIA